jgi:hypothetical protein
VEIYLRSKRKYRCTQEITANIKKNEILVDYNKYMGGVDLLDQMTKYYAMDKKSRK